MEVMLVERVQVRLKLAEFAEDMGRVQQLNSESFG